MNLTIKHKRKGSATAVVICLFVAIFALAAGLLNTSKHRRYTTKKLNEVSYTREYAFALAELAKTYIKDNQDGLYDILKNDLSCKRNELKDKTYPAISMDKLRIYFGDKIDKLSKVANGKNIECKEIKFILNKSDFDGFYNNTRNSIEDFYPREKSGMIRICFDLKFDSISGNKITTEGYEFGLRVKVTAALIPVLSKFTLYIEKALEKSDIGKYGFNKFNQLANTDSGKKVKGCEYNPWNLKNHGNTNMLITDLKGITHDKVGLVYLGSEDPRDEICLALSRATTPVVDDRDHFGCAEGMHLLNEGTNDGFYPEKIYGKIYSLNYMDIGLAFKADTNNNIIKNNHEVANELVKQAEYGNETLNSSILKLYGAGCNSDFSPTLVLGNVKSRNLRLSGYKGEEDNAFPGDFIPFLSEENYQKMREKNEIKEDDSEDSEVDLANFFKFIEERGEDVSYNNFKDKFSTRLVEHVYNWGLFNYMANLEQAQAGLDYPISRPEGRYILNDNELFRYAFGKNANGKDELTTTELNAIPKPFNKMFKDADLTDMNIFIKELKLKMADCDYSRISYYLLFDEFAKNERTWFTDKLIANRLAKKRNKNSVELNYEGYMAIDISAKKLAKLDLNQMVYSKNCGIVVPEGDIKINGNIKRDNELGEYILHIIALNGNIIIGEGVSQVDAALCANEITKGKGGKIKLEGDGKNNKPVKINGSIAMKYADLNSMKRGVNLDYYTKLSALPNIDGCESQEKELLMYAIYDSLEFLY